MLRRALAPVMLPQSEGAVLERLNPLTPANRRRTPADLGGQLRHIFELTPRRRPQRVAPPPAGAGLQPDREGLGKVLGGMRLGVPLAQVLHMVAAGRARAVLRRIAPRGRPKQRAPARSPAQTVSRVDRVPGLVAQDAHLPLAVGPLHLSGHP